MFKHVLVAVNAISGCSPLASAIDVVLEYNARISALHVVDPTPCFVSASEYDISMIVETLQAQGRDIVAQCARLLGEAGCCGDARMITLPMAGFTVGRTIAAVADDASADLIVLGQGESAWSRCLRENVTSEVRRHTSAPLQIASAALTVRPTRRADARWIRTAAAGAE
jgi:nucleotide-binding universal stress UspA family protein